MLALRMRAASTVGRGISRSARLVVAVLLLGTPQFVHAQAAVSGFEWVSYQLVSSTRFDRTRTDFVYRVVVRNTTETFGADIVGTLSSTTTATAVIDGSAAFGDIPAQTNGLSVDTITIRQDRTQAFNPGALNWTFGGTLVAGAVLPPDPGPAGELTVEGVDENSNGVRDDIERAVARSQPTNVAVRDAMLQYARELQSTYAATSSESVARQAADGIFRAIDCIAARVGEEESAELVASVEQTFLNTRARLAAYVAFERQLSGAVFTASNPRPGPEACDAAGATP